MQKHYLADINNIIALCHIIDEFKEFQKRLMPMISPKYNRDFIFQLWDISEGKLKLGAKKAKKFYNENKYVIDTINQYSNILTFINLNYGFHGEQYGILEFFYKYISNHKDEIDKILAVLEKLKALGFSRFQFNENLDFTQETYEVHPSLKRNFRFTYLANIEVIPNYIDHINYKTTDSNYKMELNIVGDEISQHGKTITLNSLLFNPNYLPTKVDKKNTFEHLLKLKNAQKETSRIIRNSVNLSISISDLEHQFNSTNETISQLDGVKNKEELLTVLSNIKDNVEKLKTLSIQHNCNVSQQQPLLTPEVLEREKTLYLKRRTTDSIDLC